MATSRNLLIDYRQLINVANKFQCDLSVPCSLTRNACKQEEHDMCKYMNLLITYRYSPVINRRQVRVSEANTDTETAPQFTAVTQQMRQTNWHVQIFKTRVD